ncbi:MAG: HNH endonuclease signature motif containing protein [Vulcanibacillus sp.]
MPHQYTNDQKKFIQEVAPGRHNTEITDLFNAKFGTRLKESQIRGFKKNHKINSNVPRKNTDNYGLFTKEQKEFIEKNVKGLQNDELATLVSETFNLSITAKQMNTFKKNHGLTSGINKCFKKGHTPVNKGTKGMYNVGGNKTSFKKGQKPLNYKPVGTERIDRDGYTLIKVSDKGNWHERWKLKHRVLWEKENGPIPKGHVLLFADRNKKNITLDNLILITHKQLARLNKNHLIANNAEITKSAVILADLYSKIGDRVRSK